MPGGYGRQMIAAVVLSLALGTPTPPPAADAYQIYKTAMQHLGTLEQPNYIVDTEHWVTTATAQDNAQTTEWDERRIFDSTARRECVLNVPYNPSEGSPLIGDSYFAPDTWLISHRQLARGANTPNMTPDLSDLKVIANVISVGKPSYDIRLVGTDPLTKGGSAYHLSLRPLSDPQKHNLRELWINTSTFDIMRAIIEGDYRPTYNDIVQDTFVLEDFGRIGPYWLVIRHIWTYAKPFSGITYRYDATSFTMKFPASLPEWFFEGRAFAQHSGEVTGVLGP